MGVGGGGYAVVLGTIFPSFQKITKIPGKIQYNQFLRLPCPLNLLTQCDHDILNPTPVTLETANSVHLTPNYPYWCNSSNLNDAYVYFVLGETFENTQFFLQHTLGTNCMLESPNAKVGKLIKAVPSSICNVK